MNAEIPESLRRNPDYKNLSTVIYCACTIITLLIIGVCAMLIVFSSRLDKMTNELNNRSNELSNIISNNMKDETDVFFKAEFAKIFTQEQLEEIRWSCNDFELLINGKEVTDNTLTLNADDITVLLKEKKNYSDTLKIVIDKYPDSKNKGLTQCLSIDNAKYEESIQNDQTVLTYNISDVQSGNKIILDISDNLADALDLDDNTVTVTVK